MARAVWNGQVIAQSDTFEEVEGNVYFPPEALNRALVKESSKTTFCPWKGTASYISITVDGNENSDAGWYYPEPKSAARNIKNHYAFWRGVEVER